MRHRALWRLAAGCLACGVACGLMPAGARAAGLSALAGDWLAPAEDADDVDAIVTLAHAAEGWRVRIKAIRITRADQAWHDDSICVACPPPARGQPLKGLQIAWGWQERNGALVSGQILDPGDGRVYDCDIQPSADGKTLQVHAYLGLKLLGHTMVWTRP